MFEDNKIPSRSCPACGSDIVRRKLAERVNPDRITKLSYASRKPPELMHLELWECDECRSLYCPRPIDQQELAGEYEAAGYDSTAEAIDEAHAYVSNLLRTITIDQMNVLDVGAGDGAFLDACKNAGASAITGIEPSIAAIECAPPGVRECLFPGTLATATDLPNNFDIATFFMTIEHVVDPKETLEQIVKHLTQEGHIAVVCHDRLGIVNRVLRTKSPIFDLEHQQIFTKTGVGKLFERLGLEIVSSKSFSNRYTLKYWIRLLPMPNKVRKILNKLPPKILGLKLSVNVGNLIIIGRV